MKKLISLLVLFVAFGIKAQIVGGYVPSTRSLTINGTSYNLSANRTWSLTPVGIGAWGVVGNALGNNTSFIGSTDNRSFKLFTNNTYRIKFDSIGNNTVQGNLAVNGNSVGINSAGLYINADNTGNNIAVIVNSGSGNNADLQLQSQNNNRIIWKNTVNGSRWFASTNSASTGVAPRGWSIGFSSNAVLGYLLLDTTGRSYLGVNPANTTTLGGLSIGYNTTSGIMHVGKYNATSNSIWGYHTSTPTTSNYNLNFDANNMYMQSGTSVITVVNGTTKFTVSASLISCATNINVIGTGSISSTFTTAGAFTGQSSILSNAVTGGIGYATGSGSTVTQATSRTTGVTINAVNGAITLVSSAGLATYQTFVVTNSAVAATDIVKVCQKSGTDLNIILVTAVAAGSFNISFATTGGVTVEQPVFNFSVFKGVAN